MNTSNDPGTTFRNALRRAGITQQQLADTLKVSQSAIASWGSAGKGVPPKRAPQIGKLLDIDASRIAIIPAGMQAWAPAALSLVQNATTSTSVTDSGPAFIDDDDQSDDYLVRLVQSKHLSDADRALISALIVRLIG